MRFAARGVMAAVVASVVLAGCDMAKKEDPATIDTRPSYSVRYATEVISPAVVQLDVVQERFSQGQSQSIHSIGSGFIIDKQGHILTNFHVAGRAKRIEVTLANEEHVRASLVGSDHWTDLALVQLDMEEVKRRKLSFEVATLGDSSKVTLGQPVMAVGTPYGLSRTVTAGIISNTDRAIDEGRIDGYETGWFNNWLQTDAAINPGNSGGPLINLKGEVIGINTRGISEGNNLGFAIPIDVAKEVVKEILGHGKVARSYLGVQLQPLQDLEKFYDLEGNKGVLVASVEQDSPAANAGLAAEDIILAVNDKPVNVRFPEQLAAVQKLLSDFPVGSMVNLTVRKAGGRTVATTVTAASTTTRPTQATTVTVKTERLESSQAEEVSITVWGLSVRDLTRKYLRDRRLPYTQGVLVTGARTGSPAERGRLQGGDIILSVDGKKVTSADELKSVVEEWEKKPNASGVGVDVTRDRGQLTLIVKP